MSFNIGQHVQNRQTENVYRLDENGMTLLSLGDTSVVHTVISMAELLGVPVPGVGETFPYSLIDPNDYPNDFTVVGP